MSNDDMLRGFRLAAGLPAPGKPMTGWCAHSTQSTFGQWVSGLARLSCALNDPAVRDKAISMTTGWEKTIGPNGNPRMKNAYCWEKMSCGLVDLAQYADYPHAMEILERITKWAWANIDRSRVPATREDRAGRGPKNTNEWYTLSENSFRAYRMTGNKLFLDFANLWLYPTYWNKFENTPRPEGVAFLHSYSHVNTFSSAAMAYAVTGNPRYLAILRNAYDWARGTQTYASGGYGPGEWTMPTDGSLGDALDVRIDHAEIPCGSWAGFKLSRYLTAFTGEARYGDWIERLLYNGIGSALPTLSTGKTFYYANYNVGMATKQYGWSNWSCCSGTYIQDVADYHNIVYYHDDDGLYINLLLPSEVTWQRGGETVRLAQQTEFPAADSSTLTLELTKPAEFSLKVRIPSWCTDAKLEVNGKSAGQNVKPDQWASIKRTWKTNDKVVITFPMPIRAVPVDPRHPQRIAILYGPLLMVQNAAYTFPLRGDIPKAIANLHRTPGKLELQSGPRLTAAQKSMEAVVTDVNMAAGQQIGRLYPLYTVAENKPYRAYFDMDDHRFF